MSKVSAHYNFNTKSEHSHQNSPSIHFSTTRTNSFGNLTSPRKGTAPLNAAALRDTASAGTVGAGGGARDEFEAKRMSDSRRERAERRRRREGRIWE